MTAPQYEVVKADDGAWYIVDPDPMEKRTPWEIYRSERLGMGPRDKSIVSGPYAKRGEAEEDLADIIAGEDDE